MRVSIPDSAPAPCQTLHTTRLDILARPIEILRPIDPISQVNILKVNPKARINLTAAHSRDITLLHPPREIHILDVTHQHFTRASITSVIPIILSDRWRTIRTLDPEI